MKIKHFAGYGSVNATRVGKIMKRLDGCYNICIRVEGNHEWGLLRKDYYDIFNWLLKKFDKGVASYQQIVNVETSYGDNNGVEYCNYYITYEK